MLNSRNGKIYGAANPPSESIVFALSPPTHSGLPWTETVVYNFGSGGVSSLILGSNGRLYGATHGGGRFKSGSIFELTPRSDGSWTEGDLYSFPHNGGALYLPSGLTLGTDGVLYGVTQAGGPAGSNGGTIFSLSPPAGNKGSWTEALLYSFEGVASGFQPVGNLALDSSGALYGTTVAGDGGVFQLSPPTVGGGAWTENLLYSFQGGSDGSQPAAGLVFDADGSLYGTTQFGGNFACSYNGVQDGCGTAFKLIAPSGGGGTWTEQTLHAFAGGSDGVNPGGASLAILGTAVYGVTNQGGNGNPQFCLQAGCGTVFSITQ